MRTIYLTHTEEGKFVFSDTMPEIVEDLDAEGYKRSDETSYNPYQGWWSEADSSDICRVLGVGDLEENTYTTIEVK